MGTGEVGDGWETHSIRSVPCAGSGGRAVPIAISVPGGRDSMRKGRGAVRRSQRLDASAQIGGPGASGSHLLTLVQVNALSELNPSEAIVHSLPLPLPQKLARPCLCSQQLSTGRRGSPPFARSGSRNLTRERRKEKKSRPTPLSLPKGAQRTAGWIRRSTRRHQNPQDLTLRWCRAHPSETSDRRRSLPVRLSKHLIGRGNRIRVAWIKSGDCCDGAIVRARAIKPRTGTAAPPRRYRPRMPRRRPL